LRQGPSPEKRRTANKEPSSEERHKKPDPGHLQSRHAKKKEVTSETHEVDTQPK